MTTAQSTHHHKAPARKDRRNNNPHTAAPRRSAQEFCKSPPRGWTAEVLELDDNTDARKRLRLLVLKGDYGWRMLPFTTVRVMKKVTTSDGSTLEVADDMDLLPTNIVEGAIEANLFRDHPLQTLVEVLADYHAKQMVYPPPHKRPLVQRPFEALRHMELSHDNSHESHDHHEPTREEDMAKSKVPAVKSPAKDLCFMLLLG